MTFSRWAAVATLAAMLHLQAQITAPAPPPPAPSTGPTMEPTIAFINDAFANQGVLSYQRA